MPFIYNLQYIYYDRFLKILANYYVVSQIVAIYLTTVAIAIAGKFEGSNF